MSVDLRFTVRIYEGPSLAVPFRAVVAEFGCPYAGTILAPRARELLAALFGRSARASQFETGESLDFPSLVANRASYWQESIQPLGLAKSVSQLNDGTYRIALEYFSVNRAHIAVRAGFAIASAVFARAENAAADIADSLRRVRDFTAADDGRQFGSVSNAYVRAARSRGMFVHQISASSNVLQYGQGTKGFHQREAANSRDSATGHRLAEDKSNSNRLIRQLGFPGVEHGVAEDLAVARQIAAQLGAPLVIKPVDRNGSVGVSVGIESQAELEAAFTEAKALSDRGRVLVERFVAGDEHRLSVFGGKFFRASHLVVAHITGDGTRSIAALIEADNVRRRKAMAAGDYLFELVLDAKMAALLRKQGFAPDDILPAGRVLRLAGTSNLKSGGHREDVTARIHPDNVAMAEAVARSFHLDAAGIDFITEDIARPWTEVRCAIIEVNSNPGTSVELAAEVMDARFPGGSDGRIPSVLFIDAAPELAAWAVGQLAAAGRNLGWTSPEETWLGGQRRFAPGAELPARILGLILDSNCDALVVSCTVADVEKHGLPHTRYDIAVLPGAPGISSEMQQLIAANAKHIVLETSGAPPGDELQRLIGAL